MALPVKLYVTYRSEYLVLRDLCVGVRDRASGAWQPLHVAACAHVLGPLGTTESEPREAVPIRVGERLCFYAAARRIATGAVVAVEEPSRALLCEADRHWEQLFRTNDPHHTAILLAAKG
jgi:hypothetical protein